MAWATELPRTIAECKILHRWDRSKERQSQVQSGLEAVKPQTHGSEFRKLKAKKHEVIHVTAETTKMNSKNKVKVLQPSRTMGR